MRRTLILTVLLALLAVFITPGTANAAYTRTMYLTGYNYWDNDPPGSGEIAYAKKWGFKTLHNTAAGKGTFTDPITMAVGIVNGKPQFAPGTKMYIPALRRYFIVEDSCASCGKGYERKIWIDAWVDGRTSSVANSEACMNKITGLRKVIVNPPNGYSVASAVPISQNNSCTRVRSDVLVRGPNT